MIRLLNIEKKYNDREILNNINLLIEKNQITFIVGTSGAGKSTLLNIIGGLLKPTSGEIYYDDINIEKNLVEYRAQNIGFIFQEFNLISGLSVFENVRIATESAGVDISKDEIISKLKEVGINNPYQKVDTLSGGEKQRTAIIRSICKDADILIADEPTGSLDSENSENIFKMLNNLKNNKHIIIVSHDMDMAKKYADRIISIKDGKIEEDKIINQCFDLQQGELKHNSVNKNEKRRKKVHSILTLGKNSVRLRIGKIVSIAVVIALAITAITTVVNLNKLGNSLNENVNVNYLENDLMNLYYEATPNSGYMEYPFKDEDIVGLEEKYDIKEIVKIYVPDNHDMFFTNNGNSVDACLKQVNINDFFENRTMSNNIEGSFITKDNEIIVAEDVAEKLFDNNCIGEKISINNGNGYSVEYTIVGINHTKNPQDEIYSFISSNSLKQMLYNSIIDNLYDRQVLARYYDECQSVISGGIYGSMQKNNGDEQVIYGSMPSSSNEILLSSTLLSNVLQEFDIDCSYSKQEIEDGKMDEKDIEKIFKKTFAINENGVFQVNISGIYASDEIEMRFTEGLIEEIKIIDPVELDTYVNDSQEINSIQENIENNYMFKAKIQLDTLKQNIANQTMFFSVTLIIFGIVLICISLALLLSFSKIAVLERKREVAIVKSLGFNNGDVLSILLFDNLTISGIALLISMILYAVIEKILPKVLSGVSYLSLNYPLGLIILINVIFTILIVLLTSMRLRKLVKTMPADLLSN